MLTEQGVMHTEVVFNDTKTERYLLRKVWDESKAIVCLIMTNPSSANAVTIDMTVHYSICNLFKLGYGGIEILNMTSEITTKLDTKNGITLSDVNIEYIQKSAEKSEKVILAFGRIGENNKKVRSVQLKLLEKLNPFSDKLFVIASDSGEFGFHPLAPQIRFSWNLIPFVCPEYLQEKKEDKPEESPQDKAEEQSTGEAENKIEEKLTDETENSPKSKKQKKDGQNAQTA